MEYQQSTRGAKPNGYIQYKLKKAFMIVRRMRMFRQTYRVIQNYRLSKNYSNLLYKMGHYFLDIPVSLISVGTEYFFTQFLSFNSFFP